jgi:ATP-dependent exoDNAse (exonuclease V) alpha subunit
VPRSVIESFSARGREVVRAIERFRAEHGRAPEVGELQALKLENRRAKVVVTKADLQRSWNQTAARHDFDSDHLARGEEPARAPGSPGPKPLLEDRIEQRLTERAATFPASELRAVALEQSAGELLPQQAIELTQTMISERRVLSLQGGLMTTLIVRAREQAIERRFAELAKPAGRDVGEPARTHAADQVRERIGAPLSEEQATALRAISGPERTAVLVGPAGTGKGVVIDAAAYAEQLAGAEAFGVAVAGATAQRLGQDSPALAGRTLTLDALVSRAERGRLALGQRTTVYFDEAGMADTARLDSLTELIADRGAKLVVIGDAAQLPSIGAGGMFERLAELVPGAELSNVRRTLDPAEQRAWAELRAGRAERAMAHYLTAGRLHFSDERDQAVEHAVSEWAKLTEVHPVEEVALISDASNKEIDRMNARAQHYRAARGALGDIEVRVPGVHYGLRAGDRVALIAQHRQQGMVRIENGERGKVLAIEPSGAALIEFDSGERRGFAAEELERVRLGYAQHIHRAQGATVTRTLVVTGGWQTSKEPAYVEASRARRGTDWFIAREDLGVEGQDSERIARLAQRMSESRAQVPSLARAELPDMRTGPGFRDPVEHARAIPPGIARVLHRLAREVAQPERDR